MAKKEKIQKNNFGKKLVVAPAVMVASLGLCLICLVYLNKFGTDHNNILGVKAANSTVITETTETKTEGTEITFWSKIVEENPTYRDGWIRLAVGYYEGGDINKAIEALDKAKEVDPNNETVKSLKGIIQ